MVPKDCIIGGAERWVGSQDEDRRNPAACHSCSVASTPTVTLTWKDTRGWSCPLPFNAFRLHTPFLLIELILSRRHKTLLLWSCQGCLGLRAVKDGPYRSAVLLISAHRLHPVSQGTLLSLSTPSLHNPALDHSYLSEQHLSQVSTRPFHKLCLFPSAHKPGWTSCRSVGQATPMIQMCVRGCQFTQQTVTFSPRNPKHQRSPWCLL